MRACLAQRAGKLVPCPGRCQGDGATHGFSQFSRSVLLMSGHELRGRRQEHRRRTGNTGCPSAAPGPGFGCVPVHDRAAARFEAGFPRSGEPGPGLRTPYVLHRGSARFDRGRPQTRVALSHRNRGHRHAHAQVVRRRDQDPRSGTLPRAHPALSLRYAELQGSARRRGRGAHASVGGSRSPGAHRQAERRARG